MQYQNGLFAYNGRINRLTYILQNIMWNTLAAPFVYYPLFVTYLNFNPSYAGMFEIVRWFFYIPLRMIDLKRIRDIVDRELSLIETVLICGIFSIPYVDFLTSIFLSSIRPFYFAKSKFEGEIKKNDKEEASIEAQLLKNKELFQAGKISRAIYEVNREKLKK